VWMACHEVSYCSGSLTAEWKASIGGAGDNHRIGVTVGKGRSFIKKLGKRQVSSRLEFPVGCCR
jgi:hypothetical protein